ncbi:MAG: ThuA domain-containing protein, partial [Anaerolineales bacterium]|nr:ThuA domain-containing protein [Anaerolineales bacterium]
MRVLLKMVMRELFRFKAIYYLIMFVWLLLGLALGADSAVPQETAASKRVLMFVAYNDVWWAEYKVVYEALLAQGYEVDVRSSGVGEAYTYGSAIDNTPAAGGDYPNPASYGAFQALFTADFGAAWDDSWNAVQNIPLNGRIQDVESMAGYDAMLLPGGRGTIAYRYDGSYEALSPQGAPGTHVTTAAEVQAAAEKLNQLINEALAAGKPVGAECHGAPLLAFARVSGTAGEGFDGLGRSILQGHYATGYPLNDAGDTAVSYANLGITFLADEKLVLDGPEAPDYDGLGRDMVVTTADWYPESAAYFARTILNMLASYPTAAQRSDTIAVLVYGGDEKSNYLPQLPGSYLDLVDLLNDPNDDFEFVAMGTDNPADLNEANLQNYDVLLFFGHDAFAQNWQTEINNYVDNGGGIVGLHHAIYNQAAQKGTLLNIFGAGIAEAAWPAEIVYGPENRLINVNLGHFVSSYGVHLLSPQTAVTQNYESLLIPNRNLDNDNTAGYYSLAIEAPDELYLAT